jgi:hypothetical protein
MIETLQEQQAKLPFIASRWYDYLVERHPELSGVMSRQDYISSFINMHGQPVVITSGSNTL